MIFKHWVGFKKLNLDKKLTNNQREYPDIPKRFDWEEFHRRVNDYLEDPSTDTEELRKEWTNYEKANSVTWPKIEQPKSKNQEKKKDSGPRPEPTGSMSDLDLEIHSDQPTTELTTSYLKKLKEQGEYELAEQIQRLLNEKEKLSERHRTLKLFSSLIKALVKFS